MSTRLLKITAAVLVVGAFLLALFSQADELRDYRWDVAPLYLGAAVLVALGRGPFVVYPWWHVVTAWGYHLTWRRALRLYFHSGLARYIPGQYWYVLSRAFLAERDGIPKSVTAASTLVETVLVTGSAGGVALLGLATAPGWSVPIVALFAIAGLAVSLILILLTGSPLSARFWDWAMQRIKRDPLPSQLSWSHALRALLGCYANWLLYGLIAVFALASVSGGSYLADAPAVVGIFAASVLGAAVVLFVPQGIVIREGILVYLLHTLLGVAVPEAIAAAALTRLIAMLAEGIWALATVKS